VIGWVFLLCTEGQSRVSYQQLLEFTSGADHIPVLGFEKSPALDFYSPVPNVRRLPYASTCDICLFLPRGVGAPELLSMMEQSVLDCSGFGFV